jgi:hypothetical protein
LIDELWDFEKELSSAELLAFCSLRQSGDLTLMSLEGKAIAFSLLFVKLSPSKHSLPFSTAGVEGCGRTWNFFFNFIGDTDCFFF